MNATGLFSMEFLRPADVGAHCVRPRATPYGSYRKIFCILQQVHLLFPVNPGLLPFWTLAGVLCFWESGVILKKIFNSRRPFLTKFILDEL